MSAVGWAAEIARQQESLTALGEIKRETRRRLGEAFAAGDDDALADYALLLARLEQTRSVVLLSLNALQARAQAEGDGS